MLLLKPPALKQTKKGKSLFAQNERLVGELLSLATLGLIENEP